jgi:hypothetical protein
MHKNNMKNHLASLKMSEKDFESFSRFQNNVKKEVMELRAVLESVDAKNRERIWIPNQTSGDLDETRL